MHLHTHYFEFHHIIVHQSHLKPLLGVKTSKCKLTKGVNLVFNEKLNVRIIYEN
jgi:hypothetical protein